MKWSRFEWESIEPDRRFALVPHKCNMIGPNIRTHWFWLEFGMRSWYRLQSQAFLHRTWLCENCWKLQQENKKNE